MPVRHSLDLELGDEEDDEGRAFLLAACHTELGRLMGRMWTRRAGARTEPGAWPGVGAAAAEGGAQQGAVAASPGAAGEVAHLRAALALFPDYVAGSLALAQVGGRRGVNTSRRARGSEDVGCWVCKMFAAC